MPFEEAEQQRGAFFVVWLTNTISKCLVAYAKETKTSLVLGAGMLAHRQIALCAHTGFAVAKEAPDLDFGSGEG
jgi:hypothetical protein